mgnify:CR=1 FL=1
MPHGFALRISSYDDLDVSWKAFRQPERYVPFAVGLPISKIVDSLKHKYNAFVDDFRIADGLTFNRIITHLQPVCKVFPELLLVELHLLPNIQCFPELDKNAIECVEVVTVVPPSCCEVHQYQILALVLAGLMILVPLAQQRLLANTAVGLHHQWFVLFVVLHRCNEVPAARFPTNPRS